MQKQHKITANKCVSKVILWFPQALATKHERRESVLK